MTTSFPGTTNGFSSNALDDDALVSGDAGSAKRSNALTNKLTSVLSSSYADSDIRDALKLLDARGAQNAQETRLNLRFEAQQEVIRANARVVEDFGKVASQLKRVGALITVLNQTCNEMRTHIQSAKQETAPMLEEASTLLARKNETESKQQLLNAFNQHFLISDEDLTTLTSSAEPVDDRYFAILSRTKQIHKDCEILLGYENQRLGLELMEQTARTLDSGYKKLYNWVQREFKGLDLEDPHVSGSIRRSLRALSERPTLFQNCLDLFGEARQVTLSQAFQTALTDSTLGASKAIEFSTHDPLRYIGDMLAWVHSTTVSEKEALEGLFISDADEINRGLNEGKTNEPWARLRPSTSAIPNDTSHDLDPDEESTEPSFDGHAALNSLISRNVASVVQTLNQRISLTIRNLSDQITIYKAYNILLFYQDIFVKLLGAANLNAQTPKQHSRSPSELQSQNSLLIALSTLQNQTLTHFQTTVSENIEAHAISVEPDSTLQPPGILQSNLALFSSILHLRAPNLTTPEFTRLYGTLLAPVLEVCGTAALSLSSPDSDTSPENDEIFEDTIYRLNYMHPITSTLSTLAKDNILSPFVTPPLRSAEQQVEKLADDLVDSVTDRILMASGVEKLLDMFEAVSASELTQRWDSLVEQLEDASALLDTFLASALIDVQDDLAKLSDKSVAKTATADAVDDFCRAFEKLVGLLETCDTQYEEQMERASEQDDNGEDEERVEHVLLREVYPRTVAELRALLS